MPTYYWVCAECEIGCEISRSIADRNTPPEGEDDVCLCEKPSWKRVYEAPMVLRASYLDGQSRGDTYNKLKEASRLERESMELPPEKRGDHRRAIKELKKLK